MKIFGIQSEIGFVSLFSILLVSCNTRGFNKGPDSDSAQISDTVSAEAENLDYCSAFEGQLKERNLPVNEVYECETPNTCVITWDAGEGAELAAFIDGSKELYVQWEWRPYEATKGWNAEKDVKYKTEGWEHTNERRLCAGIVNYAFVDILEDDSILVKATRETDRAAICPFRKVLAKSLVSCKKKNR
jgi:hypothetical protein